MREEKSEEWGEGEEKDENFPNWPSGKEVTGRSAGSTPAPRFQEGGWRHTCRPGTRCHWRTEEDACPLTSATSAVGVQVVCGQKRPGGSLRRRRIRNQALGDPLLSGFFAQIFQFFLRLTCCFFFFKHSDFSSFLPRPVRPSKVPRVSHRPLLSWWKGGKAE